MGASPRACRSLLVLASCALALGGCRGTTVTQPDRPAPDPDVTPRVGEPTTAGRAAFIVQSADTTRIVPLDPARAVVTLAGVWTALDERAFGRVEIAIAIADDPQATVLPICPDDPDRDACSLAADADAVGATLRVAVAAGKPATWTLTDARDHPCTCISIDGISADERPPLHDLRDPELIESATTAGMTPAEYAEQCYGDGEIPDLVATSVLGGVLYRNGMGHSGTCAGLNIYDGASEAIALRPGAKPPTPTMPAPRECVDAFGGMRLDWIGRSDAECMIGDPDCGCHDAVEMEGFFVRRGRLVRAVGNIDSTGGGCTCAVSMPVAPGNCPSAHDPCGDPRPFTGIDDGSDFWVATDGSAALMLAAGRLRILRPGITTPVREESIATEPIGVEFHRDTVLVDAPDVPTRFRVALPVLAAADRDFAGTARAWGDRCAIHLLADRLAEAQAACFAGLREGGKARTRGALVYNLGRIAEARNEPTTALAWYRRSDRLRPGNATVMARITVLGETQ